MTITVDVDLLRQHRLGLFAVDIGDAERVLDLPLNPSVDGAAR